MPESGPSGSVRGALSNERPYRDCCRPRSRAEDVSNLAIALSANLLVRAKHLSGMSRRRRRPVIATIAGRVQQACAILITLLACRGSQAQSLQRLRRVARHFSAKYAG